MAFPIGPESLFTSLRWEHVSNAYLNDEQKIRLCEICGELKADWVKTSTGYGFVKQSDGSYNYKGATEHDLALMRGGESRLMLACFEAAVG